MEKQLVHGELSERIIGAAIEVHRHLGPGLLEEVYESCLAHEFDLRGVSYARQVDLPVHYKGVRVDKGYRADLIVQDLVLVELKAVDKENPIHSAQVLTYLRVSGLKLGLLMNFNKPTLRDGVKRIVL